jgi:hypothetical protein
MTISRLKLRLSKESNGKEEETGLMRFQIYLSLAETPGFARDSIRNEVTREINYGII